MLVYRLSIWSDRGRIERGVESGRDDALECIHAAGIIAIQLKGGAAPVAIEEATSSRERATVWIERSETLNDSSASLVRHAHSHLKEAWLLLASAGAQEAVSHVREGLRLSRLSRTPSTPR